MTAIHSPDDTAPAAPQHRGIRSFVLRAGRTTEAQRRALTELGPRWIVPYTDTTVDWTAVFGRAAPRVLEIGFGMGEATAQIAANKPETDFIGVEVHPPGVGALLQRIAAAGLTNLRIVQHDAVQVLQHMIAPHSLDGLHIYFPDPWPKKRHHKRRLIQPDFVRLAASRLRTGGYLHCATDWQPYAEHMLAVLRAESGLENTATDYAPRPSWRPVSKFERRGLNLGHGVWDLVFTAR
ncbi:MAG: tRNA (guanosine(46)-N7)-methyltransferase TrmB [Thiomonas sp.]|jgi:tRNA (guanine-N7-)-methyltransferase